MSEAAICWFCDGEHQKEPAKQFTAVEERASGPPASIAICRHCEQEMAQRNRTRLDWSRGPHVEPRIVPRDEP